jgi:ribonuclease G
VGKKDLEETVFLTNVEAVPEVVRQLRLRNLGGIIVIDFIDMMDPQHRECVMKRLQEELERDRNHARAVEISDFGLVEMTRKRTGPSLERMLTSACPHCGGSGRRLSSETVVLGVYREMARLGERLRGAQVRLTLHPELRSALQPETREGVNQLGRALGAQVLWVDRADGAVHEIGIEVVPS